MVLNTREKLIDVARQLFVRKGVENTTMNDIANASDKGRRTIYLYFKNKRDIYNAVIERESDKLVSRLKSIAMDDSLTASEKLSRFFTVRLETPPTTQSVNPVKQMFTRENKRMERIKQMAYEKEVSILHDILEEGKSTGEFISERCTMLEDFALRLMQAIGFMDSTNEGETTLPINKHNPLALRDFIVASITNINVEPK